jgi:Tetracyclin repressor-like, C-terminal domain
VKTATRIINSDRIVRGLVSEIATKPHLARAYRERIVDMRLVEVKSVIDRGIACGELRPDTDVRVAHELLVGPLFYRLLFSGAPLNKAHANQVVDAVMRAFAAPLAGETGRRARLRSYSPFAEGTGGVDRLTAIAGASFLLILATAGR